MQKCLLIKTKDKREFFTHEENYPQLIEFSKTFQAEISIVKVENAPILDLAELAPLFCKAQFNDCYDYEIVKSLLPKKNARKTSIKNASKIRKHIEDEFLKGATVSLKKLKQKYAKYYLSDSCLCNHLQAVRQLLIHNGYTVEKISGGTYRVSL
jgi:hypothetical protein